MTQRLLGMRLYKLQRRTESEIPRSRAFVGTLIARSRAWREQGLSPPNYRHPRRYAPTSAVRARTWAEEIENRGARPRQPDTGRRHDEHSAPAL
jgi:hypothetical protein